MKKIIFKILNRTGILKRTKLNLSIVLNDKRIVIPIVNEIGLGNYLDLSEPWMLFVLKKLIGVPGYDKAFIDVGVNLGQTLIKVKSVAPNIDYIGFEPNPMCIHYVNTLIAANKMTNTELLPVGISETSTVLKLKLFSNSEVDSAASIVEGFRDEATVVRTINVPVFKFADIAIKRNSRIGVIKIDVEGAELEVIKGFKEVLETDRPVILVEVLPAYHKDNTSRISRQENIERFLKEINYKIFRIIKADNQFVKIEEIIEFGIHSDLNMCDYILIPSESSKEYSAGLR